MKINKLLFATAILISLLFISCGIGRKLSIPSVVAIGNERYYVDTLKQPWGGFGDAPERTCLYFRNVHDTLVGSEIARVIRKEVSDYLIRRCLESGPKGFERRAVSGTTQASDG